MKQSKNLIYIIGKTHQELGGSQYYQTKGFMGNSVPKVRLKEAKNTMDLITEAIDNRYLKSCHDISEGGLAVALAEMAFSSDLGVEIDLNKVPRKISSYRDDFILFSESNSRFLVEVSQSCRTEFETLMSNISCDEIGRVKNDGVLSAIGLNGNQVIQTDLIEARKQWKSTFGS